MDRLPSSRGVVFLGAVSEHQPAAVDGNRRVVDEAHIVGEELGDGSCYLFRAPSAADRMQHSNLSGGEHASETRTRGGRRRGRLRSPRRSGSCFGARFLDQSVQVAAACLIAIEAIY
jgi:hypothetical protein